MEMATPQVGIAINGGREMKKRFFTLMALAAALCACNKIENTIPEEQTTEEEIQYTPLVFTASMEGAPESKATYDATYKCASWEEETESVLITLSIRQ